MLTAITGYRGVERKVGSDEDATRVGGNGRQPKWTANLTGRYYFVFGAAEGTVMVNSYLRRRSHLPLLRR